MGGSRQRAGAAKSVSGQSASAALCVSKKLAAPHCQRAGRAARGRAAGGLSWQRGAGTSSRSGQLTLLARTQDGEASPASERRMPPAAKVASLREAPPSLGRSAWPRREPPALAASMQAAGQGQCEFVVGQTPHTPRHQNVAARRATAQLSKPARAERARSRLPDALLWPLKIRRKSEFPQRAGRDTHLVTT
jgi:hypothetical protein